MPSAWTPLANLTLGSTAATVTFSSISGIYRDLRLVMEAGISSGSAGYWRVNNDSSSTYVWIYAEGNGSTPATGSGGNTLAYWNQSAALWNYGGNPRTIITMDFLDYAVTDKHKPVLSRAGALGKQTDTFAYRWPSTSAITSIQLIAGGSDTWVAGSTFALYGIAA